MNWLDFVGSLILAAAVGSAIGFITQARNKGEGVRTFAIICTGSALVALVSTYFFINMDRTWTADPGRLSAQVVSALGFLVIGLIWLAEERQIKGLSGAANLWVTAILGVMIGSSMQWSAVLAFVIIAIAYLGLSNFQIRYLDKFNSKKTEAGSDQETLETNN